MTSEVIAQWATKKKPIYPIAEELRAYLAHYAREALLPVSYERLRNFSASAPLVDDDGNDTLWLTVAYDPQEREALNRDLTMIYAILKAEGDLSIMDHLFCDRVDFCAFGNSQPFRIRIVNSRNDNQDYYYVKQADASRVFGLELEHLLSPNRIHYLTSGDSLVEEHIVGIPGDIFIDNWLGREDIKAIRLAKELVKFNERCFIRLLGDMRSYNFVVDLTPDFEGMQVRIRAMDFDQQTYSGRMNFYRPQYFKDNNPLVFFCTQHLDVTTAAQYQREEQSLIFRRTQIAQQRLKMLLAAMRGSTISTPEKINELRTSLADHYKNRLFRQCQSMGEMVEESLETVRRNLRRAGLARRTPGA